ncbi:MAG TPA: class D sortase [Thermoanaerobaculia bacterium]|nr:class D sortase [Thermoanaerobaculia bacterium]
MSPAAARSARRGVEGLLFAGGVLALSWCAETVVRARLYQATQARALEDRLGETDPARAALAARARLDPAFVARLEIPRLGLAAIVREGDGPRVLTLAVGHVPGTSLPGEGGNVCLAAHRDGFFRGLGLLRAGDSVRLTTPAGTYAYRVDTARVVGPNDVAVLLPTPRPTLTLVTCYPFAWIGPAPRRYVVTARPDGGPARRAGAPRAAAL